MDDIKSELSRTDDNGLIIQYKKDPEIFKLVLDFEKRKNSLMSHGYIPSHQRDQKDKIITGVLILRRMLSINSCHEISIKLEDK